MIARIINILANTKKTKFISFRLLRIFGVDIPCTVRIGSNFILAHGGIGVVVHPKTVIGMNVKIYQQVTIGRSDIWNSTPRKEFKGVTICDNVIICAGAKIITSGDLTIGKGCIIGANAVLSKSTGENEVWAGIPAKKIRDLTPKEKNQE